MTFVVSTCRIQSYEQRKTVDIVFSDATKDDVAVDEDTPPVDADTPPVNAETPPTCMDTDHVATADYCVPEDYIPDLPEVFKH